MFRCNNDRLLPEKYAVKDHISNTKVEKGHHYYIQTQHKDLFSHLQSYSKKTLRKNTPKSAQKYKRNVLMPPGYPITYKSYVTSSVLTVKDNFDH